MSARAALKIRPDLQRLIDKTARSHKPVLIAGKKHNAVLVSEADWSAIQETLHLLSIPGMRASIRKGLKTPVAQCAPELRW